MHAMVGAGKWRSSEASTSSTLIVARSRGRLCSPVLEGVPPQSSRLGAESFSGPLRLSFSRTRCPSRAGASEHFRQRSTVPYLCLLTRFLTKVGITGLETAGWGCLLTPFAIFGHGLGTPVSPLGLLLRRAPSGLASWPPPADRRRRPRCCLAPVTYRPGCVRSRRLQHLVA